MGKLNRNTKEVFATNLKENILSREFHKSSEKFQMELRGNFQREFGIDVDGYL
jgi:hypothetical protein